jgi:pimeloyl-ACP methyl ester carboxylesterase
MTERIVPGTDFRYHLIAYDRHGAERGEDGVLASGQVASDIATQPVTDVVLLSHGWNGDIPSAISQYDRWIGAMLACDADRRRAEDAIPGFRALVVGLHWPSKAWGDEELSAASQPVSSYAAGGGDVTVEALIDYYSSRLGGTPRVKAAVRTVVESALTDIAPAKMPPQVVDAYKTIDAESGLQVSGVGAVPGDDREPFDPQEVYRAAQEEPASFGQVDLGGLLAPLRTLTFWSMKRRARSFGEGGAHDLLGSLQQAVPKDRQVRFHLVGHSFGCIVTSACIAGQPGRPAQQVDSLVLLQGALSLWSYCSSIPAVPRRAGYFHPLIAEELVSGPIVTTQSVYDRAVGTFYPLGAEADREVVFVPGQLPKYGGVGSYGAQGPDVPLEQMTMLTAAESYRFRPHTVYNLNASQWIKDGDGPSGAHSDICHPEVAHVVWEAMTSAVNR